MTRWSGKLLGFIAGWLLLRHPAGGLVGLLIGHAFDSGWFASRHDGAYAVLGVTPEATDGEVDQAYRRLISQYHPDRVSGAAADLRAQAERKASQINVAYDRIKSTRGRR